MAKAPRTTSADPVEAAAAELYALPPDAFTAARTARVAALRTAGDRDGAAAVGRLPKPTVAASLVDRLVRERSEVVQGLLALGNDLRAAQSELDAARLKELGATRRQLVAEAVEQARGLAEEGGHAAGPAVLDEVATTLTAAILDPAAGGAVATGRLVRPIPADGAGDALADLVVLPDASPALATIARRSGTRPARPASTDDAPKRDAARRDAERAVADAERAAQKAGRRAADAEEDLADAVRRRDEADRRAEDLRTRIAELRRRLDAAEDDAHTAEREVRDGRTAEREARRAADDAADALAASRRRRDELG